MKNDNSLALLLSVLFLFLFWQCKVPDYRSTSQPVDHQLWDSLLQEHVDEEGFVDYPGFIADSSRLNIYLQQLSNHHPNDQYWTEAAQIAYWINAYNAFTVKLIIDHYPVESIKDIKRGIPFVNTVWDLKFIQIEGAEYDLNNIEHGILRSKFDEPRIHFAVNCASHSCPKLARKAFVAEKLDQQLSQAARAFLSNPSRNVIAQDKLKLSRIFQWYRGDFPKGRAAFVDFLNRYAPVEINPDAEVSYLSYDWRLNERAD